MERESGRFVVEVKRCESATWQGSIKRGLQEEAISFRSALELLKIMDGALVEGRCEEEAEE